VLIDGGLDGQTIRFEGNIGSRGGGGIIVSHAGPE
jgi:predicted outer membrane repeat protein